MELRDHSAWGEERSRARSTLGFAGLGVAFGAEKIRTGSSRVRGSLVAEAEPRRPPDLLQAMHEDINTA
jgi:hypothetical protein